MKINASELEDFTSSLFDKMCAYRKHLHMNPELSYEEYNTASFVKEKLISIGLKNIKSIGGTGVIVTIFADHHTKDQECIAFRADLDALPIHEENEVSYRSKVDGVMHACGHDVHSSILLGLAEVLHHFRNHLSQPVKLIFQPGEEVNPGGANLIIDEGGLLNPKVAKIFALHVFPDFEFGHVGFREGLYMASSDELHIEITGKGGHGALPGQTINPMFMGADFILRARDFIKKNTPDSVPSVINFGRFEALGSTNVVPQNSSIKGTFRTMDEDWRAKAKSGLHEIAETIEKEYGGVLKLNISKGYPFLRNDPELTSFAKNVALSVLDNSLVHDLGLRMTAEDFAFYSHLVPVCFFRLGVGNKSKGITYNVHHPKFDIDERSMKTGLLLFSSIALSIIN